MKYSITIIPAIDIMNGKCVRLTQGKKALKKVYAQDPVQVARRWEEAGARRLHIVDLDGAFEGRPKNKAAIRKIRKAVSMKIDVGGGIRTPKAIRDYLKMGMDFVILGTRAFKDRKWLRRQIDAYGKNIIVGLDAKAGRVASHGWTVTETTDAPTFALDLEEMGVRTIIYTDVLRDGMLTGPNLHALSTIAHTVRMNIIASGGIHTVKDIRDIKNLRIRNIVGIVTGKALYEKTLDIKEAIAVAKDT